MIDKNIPVITIRQPWASSIIHWGKDIENRTWTTKYRGPIYIQASSSLKSAELDSWCQLYRDYDVKMPKMKDPGADLPLGGIIGIVDLVDVVTTSKSMWFSGPFGFVLKNPRSVPFYPLKGQLGIFRIK
jgi:hypothetical protein